MPALITLTTDFGLRDPFVGVLKGVILTINPEARLVDLTHGVESFDVLESALILGQSYPHFPPGTIHLVVVDPGVGSARRPILVSAGQAYFIGPDNGVFELVYQRESPFEVRHLSADQYFKKPVSQTFHGRDIFAPSAAWLSTGIEPESFGRLITDYARLEVAKPERVSPALVRGTVLRVDKFGNLITNFKPEDVAAGVTICLLINDRLVTRLVSSYAAGRPGEVFAILGSVGFLEIAARQASAAELLDARPGTEVRLVVN
ncbi:MAG TPA: SAM-dependent chlorinase/fluorinase [Terriglobia bacterium]